MTDWRNHARIIPYVFVFGLPRVWQLDLKPIPYPADPTARRKAIMTLVNAAGFLKDALPNFDLLNASGNFDLANMSGAEFKRRRVEIQSFAEKNLFHYGSVRNLRPLVLDAAVMLAQVAADPPGSTAADAVSRTVTHLTDLCDYSIYLAETTKGNQ